VLNNTVDILYPHQKEAVEKMHNGCLLYGGVGSGKSITSLVYYLQQIPTRDLIIITTARKRDTREWEAECDRLDISLDKVTIDSWNNIGKYTTLHGKFFIFDEQRVVGKGAWSKAFIHIAKSNYWILLSATPGDTWLDYIPLFVANGYYKNRTDFLRQHVIFNPYVKWQQVQRYINVEKLMTIKQRVLVDMNMVRHTTRHKKFIKCGYDKTAYNELFKTRWDYENDCPIENVSRLCALARKIINTNYNRQIALISLVHEHPKVIIFYNFDYELDILKEVLNDGTTLVAEWNGHRHEAIPDSDRWAYLVQYTAGAEGWNCVETDTVIFYSLSYSYKAVEQAMGRIDRLNTPYTELFYYFLISDAPLDISIKKCLERKKDFNEGRMFKKWWDHK
jgi:hypothetical protein